MHTDELKWNPAHTVHTTMFPHHTHMSTGRPEHNLITTIATALKTSPFATLAPVLRLPMKALRVNADSSFG